MSGMKFEKEIFMKYLIEREASEATKKKYMTDVTTFYSYAAEAEEIDKDKQEHRSERKRHPLKPVIKCSLRFGRIHEQCHQSERQQA